jgi:AcrR family transcriptional regulator
VSTTPRPRTRLDPEVRREQILAAAERVLDGRDPADVTFEELADAAGVSRGLVYNYFGDKSGLIAAVYLRTLHQLHDALDLAVDYDATDAERLRATVHCYLSFARQNASSWRLISNRAATDHPDVRRARGQRFEELALKWGGTGGARTAARAVTGFLEAGTLDWLESGAPDLERAVDLLYTIMWRGLSAVSAQGTTDRPGDSRARQQYHAATLR